MQVISLEDFNAREETAYLLKSPVNAARLADAIDEVEVMIAKKPNHGKVNTKSDPTPQLV